MLTTTGTIYLVLGKGLTNDALVHQRKSLILILVKQTQNFAWVCLGDNSYLFVNGKEIFKFKADNKNFNCLSQFQFFLGSISTGFCATESREVF